MIMMAGDPLHSVTRPKNQTTKTLIVRVCSESVGENLSGGSSKLAGMLKNLPVPFGSSIVSKHTQEVKPAPSTPRKTNVNGKQRGRPPAADKKSESPKHLPQNQAQYLMMTPQISSSPAQLQPISLVMSHMQTSQTYPTSLLPTQVQIQPWTPYETMTSAFQGTMQQPIGWQTPPGQTPWQEIPQTLTPPPPKKTTKRKPDERDPEWLPASQQNTEGAARIRKPPEKLSL